MMRECTCIKDHTRKFRLFPKTRECMFYGFFHRHKNYVPEWMSTSSCVKCQAIPCPGRKLCPECLMDAKPEEIEGDD